MNRRFLSGSDARRVRDIPTLIALITIPALGIWEFVRKGDESPNSLLVRLVIVLGAMLACALYLREYRTIHKLASQVRVTNERLVWAMRSTKSVVWECNVKTGQINSSGYLHTVFGIPADTYEGHIDDFRRLILPEDRERVQETLNAALRNRQMYSAEFRVALSDGSVRRIEEKGRFYYSSNDQAERMLVVSADITERKQLEEAHSNLAAALELPVEAIFAEDLDGIITGWNSGAERIFGYTQDEAIGQPVSIIIPSELDDQELLILQTLRIGNRLDHHETVCVTRDGRRIFVSLTMVPIEDATGRLVGTSKIARDITERKSAEIERMKMMEEIVYLNRIASVGHLAASLAHELSQPLAAILCNSQAAEQFASRSVPDLTEIRAALAEITEDDKRARAVVESMHAIFRRQPIVSHELDLNTVVSDVHRLVSKEAQLRGVVLRFVLPEVSVPVLADEVPLQQVMMNLITNGMDAMRQLPLEQRVLTISTATRADEKYGTFVVQDNGPGVDQKDELNLFTPFFTTKETGLGMGLSICRSIVKSLGGQISFENREEGGAEFRVLLPLAARRHFSVSA
jgi:PAS domain S-box-containing protein